ncbi:hypothetical protein [Gimesia sp.]|uniref:hypothetical protein n=1 Tax=Gimesia sp. TaxID=2024833 RepID=UPI003A8D58AD
MTKNEVSRLISMIQEGILIDEEFADRVLTGFGHLEYEEQVDSLTELFKRLHGNFNWSRYVKTENSRAAGESFELNQAQITSEMNDLKELLEDNQKVQLNARESLRELEEYMGLNQQLITKVLSPFSSYDHPSYVALKAILPSELLPSNHFQLPDENYDHRLHQVVKKILEDLGIDGRKNHQITNWYGASVSFLFKNEFEDDCFSFNECIFRADNYISENVNEPIGLLWRGELACWQQDFDLAEEMAEAFWAHSRSLNPDQLFRVVSIFSYCDDFLKDYLGWKSPTDPPYYDHIGHLESYWLASEEQLINAVIRRATQAGRWDTDFLFAFENIQRWGSYFLTSHDLLPPGCWILLSEKTDCDGFEWYYQAWEAAFLASSPEKYPIECFLSCIALLTGRLLNTNRWSRNISVKQIVDKFESIQSLNGFDLKSDKTFQSAKDLLEKMELGHLSAADRLTLNNTVVSDRYQRSDGSAPEIVESARLVLGGNHLNERQSAENNMISYLEADLWDKLDEETRDYLIDAEIAYRQKMKVGEKGNYWDAILALSNGMVSEIRIRLWYSVWPHAKADLEGIGLKRRDEWNGFIKAFENIEKLLVFSRFLLNESIYVDVLVANVEKMKMVQISGRRKAAHGERISKKQAAKIYNEIVVQGALKTILGALHGRRSN